MMSVKSRVASAAIVSLFTVYGVLVIFEVLKDIVHSLLTRLQDVTVRAI